MSTEPSPTSETAPASSPAKRSIAASSSMAALTAASRPPLRASIPSQYSMSAAAFAPSSTQAQSAAAMPFSFTASPAHERNDYAVDAMHQSFLADTEPDPLVSSTILIRKLARNMTDKELRSMFLFAKDFVESEFVAPDVLEDQGYVSAVARFKTLAAAEEAKAMLDGKPNTATEAHMIVEILPSVGMGGMAPPNPPRRNTVDGTLNRGPSSSASSSGSMAAANARHATRFNSTFQGMDRISPPVASGHGGTTDFPFPQTASHIQSLFMPKSPVGAVPTSDAPRVTGKSVINDDSVDDDETGELLKDPVAYAKNGQHGGASGSRSRRPTNPQIPVSRFASMSLTTSNLPSAGVPAYVASGRTSAASVHAATGMNSNMGPNAGYNPHLAAQPFARPNYPPVNPADQNPPCNTLYVGNLPIDTSEDELKAMFSKQRGYKRLCFRTKQNGPMCFVEFEDVSFATKALNELYGHPLHNSVKGGIRLSFSKNPLGVRTGQPANAPGLPLSMNAHHSAQALKGGGVGVIPTAPFMSASGPPPGLAAPPGLQGPMSFNHTVTNGAFSSAAVGSTGPSMTSLKGPSSTAGGGVMATGPGGLGAYGGAFPDYMMGR